MLYFYYDTETVEIFLSSDEFSFRSFLRFIMMINSGRGYELAIRIISIGNWSTEYVLWPYFIHSLASIVVNGRWNLEKFQFRISSHRIITIMEVATAC